jgi:5-methylcytosine-specific restriction protein A
VHQPKKNREAHRLYNRARWRKIRQGQLLAEPLCEECQRNGIIRAATIVDHIEPHRMDLAKFYDERNLQSLCKSCHDSKTASLDGGFGNPCRGQG